MISSAGRYCTVLAKPVMKRGNPKNEGGVEIKVFMPLDLFKSVLFQDAFFVPIASF